jgi:hypothetical protein
MQAALKVSVKSPGLASLFGGAAATVASMGPAVLKSDGNVATVAGVHAELRSEHSIKVSCEESSLTLDGEKIALGAASVCISGPEYVGVTSNEKLEASGKTVTVHGTDLATFESPKKGPIKGNEEVSIDANGSAITLKQDGSIKMETGGGFVMILERDGFRLPRGGFRVTADRTYIRGRVDVG